MTEKLEHSIKAPRGSDWLLPPNTLCYFSTKKSIRSKSGANEHDFDNMKAFHYLYLRLKRANKYWDTLWDDIIRETTAHLNSTDADKTHSQKCPGEVFGADDPYVILTVGLEVRLFKWEQGFEKTVDEGARRKMSPCSALRELTPVKVLNPFEEKKDREDIEKFLVLAGRQKELIQARIERECGEEREWW